MGFNFSFIAAPVVAIEQSDPVKSAAVTEPSTKASAFSFTSKTSPGTSLFGHLGPQSSGSGSLLGAFGGVKSSGSMFGGTPKSTSSVTTASFVFGQASTTTTAAFTFGKPVPTAVPGTVPTQGPTSPGSASSFVFKLPGQQAATEPSHVASTNDFRTQKTLASSSAETTVKPEQSAETEAATTVSIATEATASTSTTIAVSLSSTPTASTPKTSVGLDSQTGVTSSSVFGGTSVSAFSFTQPSTTGEAASGQVTTTATTPGLFSR